MGIHVNGVSITDALYKFGRCPIAHEGELDPKLQFNNSGGLQIGADSWNLPSGYIWGMLLAVLIAPENAEETFNGNITVNIFGQSLDANALWGNQALLHGKKGVRLNCALIPLNPLNLQQLMLARFLSFSLGSN